MCAVEAISVNDREAVHYPFSFQRTFQSLALEIMITVCYQKSNNIIKISPSLTLADFYSHLA